MGQKTNPNIFQLGKTNNWQSKYFEKKITEHAIYSRKDLEIRNFIQKFFRNYGKVIHYCKLCYLNKSLHIFVSYHLNLSSLSFTYNNIPKIYKVEIKKHTRKKLKRQKIALQLFDIKSKTLNNQIKKVNYKKTFVSNRNSKLPNNFIEKFSKSLTNFTLRKFKLVINLKALNINKNRIFKIKTKKFLKKKLVNLRKYRQTEFFKEGVNILFTCATNKKSSKLLAQFLAIQLKNLKHHNFFFKFVKDVLTLFNNHVSSTFKGIKIKIKGRLNGRPRARSQVFKVANDVSVLTINSTINYSEETAFTPNGTLGIKVWIHESSN